MTSTENCARKPFCWLFRATKKNLPEGKSYITSQTYYFMHRHTQKPPLGSTFVAAFESYPSLDRFVYFIQSHLLSRAPARPPPGSLLQSLLFVAAVSGRDPCIAFRRPPPEEQQRETRRSPQRHRISSAAPYSYQLGATRLLACFPAIPEHPR